MRRIALFLILALAGCGKARVIEVKVDVVCLAPVVGEVHVAAKVNR